MIKSISNKRIEPTMVQKNIQFLDNSETKARGKGVLFLDMENNTISVDIKEPIMITNLMHLLMYDRDVARMVLRTRADYEEMGEDYRTSLRSFECKMCSNNETLFECNGEYVTTFNNLSMGVIHLLLDSFINTFHTEQCKASALYRYTNVVKTINGVKTRDSVAYRKNNIAA